VVRDCRQWHDHEPAGSPCQVAVVACRATLASQDPKPNPPVRRRSQHRELHPMLRWQGPNAYSPTPRTEHHAPLVGGPATHRTPRAHENPTHRGRPPRAIGSVPYCRLLNSKACHACGGAERLPRTAPCTPPQGPRSFSEAALLQCGATTGRHQRSSDHSNLIHDQSWMSPLNDERHWATCYQDCD